MPRDNAGDNVDLSNSPHHDSSPRNEQAVQLADLLQQMFLVLSRYSAIDFYHPMVTIMDGLTGRLLKDWLILDCRHTLPNKYRMIPFLQLQNQAIWKLIIYQRFKIPYSGVWCSRKTIHPLMYSAATTIL